MPRGPGRPPLEDEAFEATINVRLSAELYDRAYEAARREGVSVPEIVRQALREREEKPKKT